MSLVASPSTDPRYKSPLHLASKGGHDDIVKLLLNAGANINECRAEGTALHLSALFGKREVVRLLILVSLINGAFLCIGMIKLSVLVKFSRGEIFYSFIHPDMCMLNK